MILWGRFVYICPAAPRWYEGQQTCDRASKDPPTYILAIEMRKVAAFFGARPEPSFFRTVIGGAAPIGKTVCEVISRRWHLGQFSRLFPPQLKCNSCVIRQLFKCKVDNDIWPLPSAKMYCTVFNCRAAFSAQPQ